MRQPSQILLSVTLFSFLVGSSLSFTLKEATSSLLCSPRRDGLGITSNCLYSKKDIVGLDEEGSLLVDRRTLLQSSAAVLAMTEMLIAPTTAEAAAKIPTWSLQGGVKMPVLALNTVGLSVEDTTRALELAV